MIAQELKKIFAAKRLLLILVLGILFYILFLEKNVGMPDYSSEMIHLEVSGELKHAYGTELEEEEFLEWSRNTVSPQESEIDRWIRGNAAFGEYGIKSYRDLLYILDSLSDEAGKALTSQISGQFTEEEQLAALDQIFREDYIAGVMDIYDAEIHSGEATVHYTELSEKEQDRVNERNQEEVYSLMPDCVMRKFLSILPDFSILLILSIVLLIVPYSVKDTVEGVNILQYGSLKGCRFYWKKGMAVFISTVLLCAAETGLMVFMLKKNGAFPFMDCYVSGFGCAFITFIKLTFGQYVGMSLAYIVLLGLCLAMVTYCLSSCAHNYISAIALQIPTIIFGIVISLLFMPHFVEITQGVLPVFAILSACALFAVLGNIVRFLSINGQFLSVVEQRPGGKPCLDVVFKAVFFC